MEAKEKIKNKNGITLIALVVTIVLMLILTSTIAINVDTGEDVKNYRLMCADIELLKDNILIYYNKYGLVPITGNTIDASTIPETSSETRSFYKIDLEKLPNLSLNFGRGQAKDIYIINTDSLNVYYLDGVEYNNTTVHSKQ